AIYSFVTLQTLTGYLFFFQAADRLRARNVTGVQTCALPILLLGTLVLQVGGALGRPALFLIPVPVLGIIVLGRIYRRLSGIDLRSKERRVGKECRGLLSRWDEA